MVGGRVKYLPMGFESTGPENRRESGHHSCVLFCTAREHLSCSENTHHYRIQVISIDLLLAQLERHENLTHQEVRNGAMTRSPFLKFLTSLPTS